MVSFKSLRVSALLVVFSGLFLYTSYQKSESRSWDKPIELLIYPVAGEGEQISDTSDFVDALAKKDFLPIAKFINKEAKKYNNKYAKESDQGSSEIENDIGNLVHIRIMAPIYSRPPQRSETNNIFSNILWSLKFRYWAYNNLHDMYKNDERVSSDNIKLKMVAVYYKPKKGRVLPHSVGLQKGLIGISHLFASNGQRAQNNIVLCHEMLHMVGASDKYHPDGMPIYPEGIADIGKKPLYPQSFAEIMGGRRALTKKLAVIPSSLDSCVIGEKTAQEINWLTGDF